MTETQKRAVTHLVHAVAETIRETGTAPLGPMYLAFQSRGLSLDHFQQVIGVLRRAGLIEVTSETATWTGPQIEAAHVASA